MYEKYFDKKIFIRKEIIIVTILLLALNLLWLVVLGLIFLGLLASVIFCIYVLITSGPDKRGDIIAVIYVGIILILITLCLMIGTLI